MTEQANPSVAAGRFGRNQAVLTWLVGQPYGRWATARGRWFRIILTVGLILTGVIAWALALVQPWASRGADYGLVSMGGGLDAEKVRSAMAGVDEWLCDAPPPTPTPLRSNPFLSTPNRGQILIATPETPEGEGRPQEEPRCPEVKAGSPSLARQVLETVKGLRLAATVITPSGERWAVINGQEYREGDALAGLEITEIHEGRVKLQQDGITCLLRMD